MQKFTLVVFSFLFIFISNAQVINKGDQLLGGSLSFLIVNSTYTEPVNNRTSNVGLYPSFGWAIKNDLVVGIRGTASYGHSEDKRSSGDKTEFYSYSVGTGGFLKKYKLVKNKFGFYFNNEATISYAGSSYNQTYAGVFTSSEGHSWAMGYAFQPGVFYKFSENFFGEGNIGGVAATYYWEGSNLKGFSISASFFQSFNLGVNYRIERKDRKQGN
jgi:hypothetical protein